MKAFREANSRFFGAPVVVYLCMDKSLSTWSVFDLGSLSQSIMLAAQEYNLGSAVAAMLVIYPNLIRKTLDIPKRPVDRNWNSPWILRYPKPTK